MTHDSSKKNTVSKRTVSEYMHPIPYAHLQEALAIRNPKTKGDRWGERMTAIVQMFIWQEMSNQRIRRNEDIPMVVSLPFVLEGEMGISLWLYIIPVTFKMNPFDRRSRNQRRRKKQTVTWAQVLRFFSETSEYISSRVRLPEKCRKTTHGSKNFQGRRKRGAYEKP